MDGSELQGTSSSFCRSNDIVIVEIEAKEVDLVFDQIYEWAVESLDDDMTYTVHDIQKECSEGLWNLRLIYNNGFLTGFFISTIFKCPQGKLFYGRWLGGRDLESWVKKGISMIEDYAREKGCMAYSFGGRAAWQKLVGYRPKGVYYYKNL